MLLGIAIFVLACLLIGGFVVIHVVTVLTQFLAVALPWIGGIILAALIVLGYSENRRDEKPARRPPLRSPPALDPPRRAHRSSASRGAARPLTKRSRPKTSTGGRDNEVRRVTRERDQLKSQLNTAETERDALKREVSRLKQVVAAKTRAGCDSYTVGLAILGLREPVTKGAARAAYRKVARTVHPDVCAGPEATRLMRLATEAYERIEKM